MDILKYFPSWLRPNYLTILRLLLLAPLIYYFLQKKFIFMLIIFIIAVITDLLDGALARYRHLESTLGSILDPLADRLLFFISLFLLAYRQINATVFYFSLISEIVLLALAIIFIIALKYLKLKYLSGANIFGKAKAIIQMLIIFLLFINLFYPLAFLIELSTWLMVATIILLYLSFFKHLFYYAFTASNRILR